MQTYKLTGRQVDALGQMGALPVEEAMAVKTHGFLLLDTLVEPMVVNLNAEGTIFLRAIHHETNAPYSVELVMNTDKTTAKEFYKGYLLPLDIPEQTSE